MERLELHVSPLFGFAVALSLASSFVGLLYIWRFWGLKDTDRNENTTIQRRFVSTLLCCLLSAGCIRALARPNPAGLTLPSLLGLQLEGLPRAAASCVGLTAVLFLGPIVQHLASVQEGTAQLLRLPPLTWITMRDLVVAPFTEEFVFRACVVRLLVAASFRASFVALASPLCFALAHTHHFREHVRRLENKKAALMQVVFQLFYTSLFGTYSTYLLLRTGSTLAVALTHSFCNHMGFPELDFLVSRSHELYRHRAWLGGAYIIGMLLYCRLLVPMTSGFDSAFQAESSGVGIAPLP